MRLGWKGGQEPVTGSAKEQRVGSKELPTGVGDEGLATVKGGGGICVESHSRLRTSQRLMGGSPVLCMTH
jgi:hypothetical protein